MYQTRLDIGLGLDTKFHDLFDTNVSPFIRKDCSLPETSTLSTPGTDLELPGAVVLPFRALLVYPKAVYMAKHSLKKCS